MSWWGIGTAVGSTIHKSIDAKKAAKKAAATQAEAARLAKEGTEFRPYDVQGLFGGATFDPDSGTAQGALSPQMQQYADILQQQAGGFLQQGQTGVGAQAGALGEQFLGGIQADPFAAAQGQFSKMEEILNPARQRQREALEGRLLRQGRLGSTGGSLQQQAYESSVEESRQRGLFDALQQSQGVTAQQAALGTQLGLLGQQQQDVGFQQGQARLGALQGLDAQTMAYLNLGSSLGGRQSAAGAQAGLFGMQGAAAGTAAQLGAAAGRGQAIQTAGKAFGDYFSRDDINQYEKGGSEYYTDESYRP